MNQSIDFGRKQGMEKSRMFHPADQMPSRWMMAAGYLCRMFVVWIALTGMMFFLCDAAGLTRRELDARSLLIFCAAVTVVLSAACVNWVTFPFVTAASVGGGIYYLYVVAESVGLRPLEFLYASALTIYNVGIRRLTDVGYTSMGVHLVALPERYVDLYDRLVVHAVAGVAIVIGIFFTFSIVKKVRLSVLLLTGGTLCIAVFTYNVTSSNTGFAMLLAALCAVAVMKMFEIHYGRSIPNSIITTEETEAAPLKRRPRRERRRINFRCAIAGGFAGFAAVVVALLAVWVPAQTTDDRLGTIQFINQYMQTARLYVTAYLMGDDIDLNSVSLYSGHSDMSPRTMDFESPEYAGTRLLVVDTSYNTPVYLRSWIGIRYDYETGTWYSADEGKILSYRQQFGEGFSPEEITYHFYDYVMPNVTNIQRYDTYKNNMQNGFLTMQVNVTRVGGDGYLMYIPSFLNTGIGLLDYNSTEPLSYKYSSYFDGIYTSRLFAANREYSAVSFVTSMRHDEFRGNFLNNLQYYQQSLTAMREIDTLLNQYPLYDTAAEPDSETGEYPLSDRIETAVAQEEIFMTDVLALSYRGESLLRRYAKMTPEERSAVWDSVEMEQSYREYAFDTYSQHSGDPYLAQKALEIVSEAGVSAVTDFPHDAVMAVIDYMAENMTYTLTPKTPENPELSAIEAFLEDTREGYCIHFATTAIALLRELGIPVRYAEGYIASSFSHNYDPNAPTRYRSTVYDYNAHAWLEVYYPSFGWVQYEATPPYMSDMYEPLSTETRPYTPPSYTPSSLPEPPPETVEETDTGFEELRARIITGCIAVLITAGVVTAAVLVVKRILWKAEEARLERHRTMDAARTEALYSEEGDSRVIARKLDDFILALYDALGAPPETGELPSEYARRLDKEYGQLSAYDIHEIMTIMEKEEFGYGLSFRELSTLADYLSDISHAIYSGLNPLQRIRLRYFKRVI